MDTQQPHKNREKVAEKQEETKFKEKGKDPPPPTAAASPPSASSSPSHEFSFTISLHSSSTTTTTTTTTINPDKTKPPQSSFAIDLSPADDIFFHGHLLPLHLLSHLPVSPRSSTNSLDSFTLPIKELVEDNNHQNPIKQSNNGTETEERERPIKSKSFSLFKLNRWRKGCPEVRREREENSNSSSKENDNNNKQRSKRKPKRFDVSHVLKRYVRMVRPMLLFRGRREKVQLRRQPYSFSGNLSWKGSGGNNDSKQDLRGRRGQFSAPASMRTSPTNSGLLVAKATINSSTSDSTMEELQAAIQAAIAHCKNSIAVEERLK